MFLFLITKHVKVHGLMMMTLDLSLGVYNLSSFEASSTILALHHIHNRLLEFNNDVGMGHSNGNSIQIFSISMVEKIHCDDSLTRDCQILITRLFLLHIRWCFGRRVWDPGKLQDRLKRIHDETKSTRTTPETCLKFYILIQYIWYRNIDKYNLSLKPWEPSWKKRHYGVKDVVSLL